MWSSVDECASRMASAMGTPINAACAAVTTQERTVRTRHSNTGIMTGR